jgi:hypothetical protein
VEHQAQAVTGDIYEVATAHAMNTRAWSAPDRGPAHPAVLLWALAQEQTVVSAHELPASLAPTQKEELKAMQYFKALSAMPAASFFGFGLDTCGALL